jgi:hypothetical protein
MEYATEVAFNEHGVPTSGTLAQRIAAAIETDSDDESAGAVWWYQRATIPEQKAIDRIFIHLTGWSLQTLIAGQEQRTYHPFLNEDGSPVT